MAACTCNYGRTGWHSAACPVSEERRGGMTPREELDQVAEAEERERLADQVRTLREALGELLDPPQGTDIRDRITKGRFALDVTRPQA